MGSGTTAEVAIKHGRQYLGCELNPDYKALQDERIAAAFASLDAPVKSRKAKAVAVPVQDIDEPQMEMFADNGALFRGRSGAEIEPTHDKI